MNKRFWQGFMAVMLGITLLMGSWSFQSAQMAVAEDGTVTYTYNDGHGATSSSPSKTALSLSAASLSAQDGKTFSGWSGSDGKSYGVGDTLPDTAITLTAKWKDAEAKNDAVAESSSSDESKKADADKQSGKNSGTATTKKVTYVGAMNVEGQQETSQKEGSKALSFDKSGLTTVPEGQEFDFWYGNDNQGYKPGKKLGADVTKLTAHWKNTGDESAAPEGSDPEEELTGDDNNTQTGGEVTTQPTGDGNTQTGNDNNTQTGNDNNTQTGDIDGETGDNTPIIVTYHEVTYRVAEDSATYSSAIVLSFGEVGLPIPANMSFNGWVDSEGTGYSVGSSFGDSAPSTLIAQLKETTPDAVQGEDEKATGPRVEYINNGVVKTHTSDSVLSLEAAGFDADDSFTGWKDSQGTEYVVGGVFGDMVPAALHAQFEKKTTEGESAPAEEQEPKTVTVTFHAGEGSVEKTLTVGEDSMPSLYDLGLSLPEGNAFWFWGTGSSVSAEEYNGSQFYSMESVKENTPSDLYAIYGPMLEAEDNAFATAPQSLDAPAKFVAVHYYVNSGKEEATKKVRSNTSTAESPASLGMSVSGYTFNHWVVNGEPTTVQSNESISAITPNATDSNNQDILELYGDWTPITTGKASLDISQTVSKEAVQRGETVYFDVTIRNTSTIATYVRIENVVEGDVSIGNPTGGGSGSATKNGNILTWTNVHLEGGASRTLRIPVTVNSNATNSAVKNTATVVKVADSIADLADAGKGEVRTGPTTTHTVDALTVRYNGNGGFTNKNESSYISSNYATAESNPFTKSGSSFLFWNTREDGTGTNYRSDDHLPLSLFYTNKMVDLYAQWTVPTYSIRVTTAQGAVKVGDTIRYTIEVSNKDAAGFSDIYVRNVLPLNLAYVSASPSPASTSGGLQWQLNVPANGSSTITVSATVQESTGTFTNTAGITQINGQTANSTNFPNSTFTSGVTTAIGTQFVRYNGNGGVVQNTGETYYQVAYTAGSTVPDLSSIILRPGFALTGWSDGTNILKVGNPLPTMPSSGILNLTAVWEASSILTLTNTPSTNYAIHGDTITYSIVVNNTGAAPATNVSVVNTLDANMLSNTEYVSHSVSAGSYSTASRQWTIGTLAANSSATLRVSYRVRNSATNGVTMALTAAITPMGASETARVTLDIYGTGLRVTKQVTGNRASTTREFTFTLNVRDYNGNRMSGYAAYTTSLGFVGTFRMDETLTFTLRHDEYITFTNLPSGTRYTVEEINHSGYWPQQSKFTGTLYDSATVNFVNSRRRNTNIPLTGYGDGNEELLWLMLPLLAGAAWLFINRRRKLMQDK